MKKLLFVILILLLALIAVIFIPVTKTIRFDAYLMTMDGIRTTVPVRTTYVINKLDVINNYLAEKTLKADKSLKFDNFDSKILLDYTDLLVESHINMKLSLFSSRISAYNLYMNQDTLINAFTLDVPIKSPNRIKLVILGNVKFDNWFLQRINETDSLRLDVEKKEKGFIWIGWET